MPQGQLGGSIGNLFDPATQRQVPATVHGTFSFQSSGDPAAILPSLQAALLQSIARVVQQKLTQNQVALPTLSQSLPYYLAEIIAQSGAAQMGAQLGDLQLQLTLQEAAPAAQGYAGALPPDPVTQTENRMKQMAQDRLDPRNYEVKARLNIGGFKINASSKDGVDTAGLTNQVTNKVRSEVVWWGIGCVIVGLVVVGLAGLGYYIYRQVKVSSGPNVAKSEDADAAKWDGKSPFTCGGSDNVRIKGVTAKLDKDTVITAQGNCRVEIVDSDITGQVGIQTGANAIVVVKGGSVTGKEEAASALGASKITFSGTKVTGKKSALGAAKIEGP